MFCILPLSRCHKLEHNQYGDIQSAMTMVNIYEVPGIIHLLKQNPKYLQKERKKDKYSKS